MRQPRKHQFVRLLLKKIPYKRRYRAGAPVRDIILLAFAVSQRSVTQNLFYKIPDSWIQYLSCSTHSFSLNNNVVLLLFKEEQRASAFILLHTLLSHCCCPSLDIRRSTSQVLSTSRCCCPSLDVAKKVHTARYFQAVVAAPLLT
jgi:hypothetical protein